MQRANGRSTKKILSFLGAVLLTAMVLDMFGVSHAALVVLSTAAVILLGAMALWSHATAVANGSEWWQDDDASGWRGY